MILVCVCREEELGARVAFDIWVGVYICDVAECGDVVDCAVNEMAKKKVDQKKA